MENMHNSADISLLQKNVPLLSELMEMRECLWVNPGLRKVDSALPDLPLKAADMKVAAARLRRFAPYLEAAFPDTAHAGGIIESPVREAAGMQRFLGGEGVNIRGKLLVKLDSHLPISGSIEARGGVYEVLSHAERIAIEYGGLQTTDDYTALGDGKYRKLFARRALAVGSTGNLGLSVGLVGAQLGFRTTVHMSAEAREWKKKLLRDRGVEVIEHRGDYSLTVQEGRRLADIDCHYVDDEKSVDLFLGYSVAALRLKHQMERSRIHIDRRNPLFVYLPCGAGSAAGGLAFGLKQVFGDAVHCFFAQSTHSPSMLLGLVTGLHEKISVQDFGIDGRTSAAGLAVGRPSRFVGKLVEQLVSGCYTVTDKRLYYLLHHLADTEGLWVEPAAAAGFHGPAFLYGTEEGRRYMREHAGGAGSDRATHLVWMTGGGMAPESVVHEYSRRGAAVSREDLDIPL